MRIIDNSKEAEKGINIIQNEAGMAFNNSEIYVEKFIKNGRHIEVQVLSDKFGNHIHLGERECSIQRSNQKLIEIPIPYFFGSEWEIKKNEYNGNIIKKSLRFNV